MRRLGHLLLAVLVAGCGTGDDSPAPARSTPTVTTGPMALPTAPPFPVTTTPEPETSTGNGTTPSSSATATSAVATTPTTPTTPGSSVPATPPVDTNVPVVRRGDRGPDVEELQRELRRHGFTIEADGWFGPATDAAVRGFQQSHRLVVDGIVGPRTWDRLRRAATGSTLILRHDGLAAVSFGAPHARLTEVLTGVLGAPALQIDGVTGWPCGDEWCQGDARSVRWEAPGGAFLVTRSIRIDDDFEFVGWSVWGHAGRAGIELSTSDGIRLGTSAAELLRIDPGAEFGHWPEPSCGDSWWSPGEFRIAPPAGVRSEPIRGWVDDDWDEMIDALDRALVANGIERGLDCSRDVMCADVFGEFRDAVGLELGWGLDGVTWLALGLPLPFEPAAPVAMLGGGDTGSEC